MSYREIYDLYERVEFLGASLVSRATGSDKDLYQKHLDTQPYRRHELIHKAKDKFGLEVRQVSIGGKIVKRVCCDIPIRQHMKPSEARDYAAALMFLAGEIDPPPKL